MLDHAITEKEFGQFSALVYRECGILLPPTKKTLLVTRLSKRLQDLGIPSFQAYYDLIVQDPGGSEFTQLLDLISTNKTDFFREPGHFEFLKTRILPELRPIKRVRIWSSACSSGEEPYSIAMSVMEGVDFPLQWDCKILASDISTRVIEKAASGIYEAERVRDLRPDTLRKHFLKGKGEGAGLFKVKPHLAAMIVFRRLNLMAERYPIKTPLDVIFCRNVMIYFDRATQAQLMAKFQRHLKPGGYLFIGHSESLQWIDHKFRYVAPTIYRNEA
ncbi:MAG: protein-glutamate O-methyltransferase [Nitrospirae bacterium]|nr:protein-glutamate O-methyltransferase [Nitrospirota bacterium]